jgi:peptidoglycan/xylan/chitin deacetylase (PgdA/CDA1 family)
VGPSDSATPSGSATPSRSATPSGSADSSGSAGPSVSGSPDASASTATAEPAVQPPKGAARAPKGTAAARRAAAEKWGLDAPPLVAPPPPAVKPTIPTREGFEAADGEEGLPPVFTRVPTKDKIVFITIDDGSQKEPDFLTMMSDLGVPYSAFLSDYLISDDYGYFTKMQAAGVTLSNHTLTHPYLPGLSDDEQRHEICGQQDKLEQEYGKRPTLFRPPYGNYTGDTLRIAKSCGIKAFPLWETEAFPTHMDWRDDDHFEPGDIILTHFQGPSEWDATMVENVRNLLNRITAAGFAVARLEDYV